ncbi:MAG: hypothetical protein IJ761_06845 [Bacteroidales bacterium]|nr:hypothetical protein [Bacteroidales bacterium]
MDFFKILRNRLLGVLTVGITILLTASAQSQTTNAPTIDLLLLEARADAEFTAGQQDPMWGMHGRYFNLKMGGQLSNKVGYFFRQRLRADAGSINFFDNTDFLYINYQASPQWRFRFGKDAMAVGGYEYDAPPIDEYMVSEYWNNIYCFQLAGSVAYTTPGGQHTFVAQVSQSPYINSLGLAWNAGLLAYNIEWMGSIGKHVSTLWSTSMIERARYRTVGTYMNLTMLGTHVQFDKWDAYLDLMHHALTADDWGNNLGYVARFNWRCASQWTLFFKSSFERNSSQVEYDSPVWIDQMVPAHSSFTKNGIGLEFKPQKVVGIRLHAYAGLQSCFDHQTSTSEYSIMANAGLTWTMDFSNLINKHQ